MQDLLRKYAGQLDLDFVRKELATFADAGDPPRVKFEEWVRAAQSPEGR